MLLGLFRHYNKMIKKLQTLLACGGVSKHITSSRQLNLLANNTGLPGRQHRIVAGPRTCQVYNFNKARFFKVNKQSESQPKRMLQKVKSLGRRSGLLVLAGLLSFVAIKLAIKLYENQERSRPHPGRGPNITAEKFKQFCTFMETPWQSFISATIHYMRGVVKEVLADDTVNTQALNFLDRLFRHRQTHEAGVELLKNVLQDQRFIDASNVYGTDLIAHVLRQAIARETFKQLIISTLKQDGVKDETVQMVKYITEQQQSEEILAIFVQNVLRRQDVLDNLVQLLKIATKQTFEDVSTQEAFVEFVLRVVRNNRLKSGMLEGFVYAPMKSFFAFGQQEPPQDDSRKLLELAAIDGKEVLGEHQQKEVIQKIIN